MSASYLERMVLGEDRGAVSWLIRGLLWPLSLVYRAGLAAFLGIYSLGLRKRCKLGVPVLSVGNLTFGGTGKTPAVQAICRMLRAQGKKVVVLSRGHGGAARKATVVSDGVSILCDSTESGDEPMLLAMTLPGVPVVVGKDRRESGKLACRAFEPDVIVLDDGLQYWQLHRDLDIVVLDAARPFGSGFVMPMGDLREPAGGLSRAGIVILNNTGGMSDDVYAGVVKRVAALTPRAMIFRCARKPVCFRRVDTGEEIDLTWAKGRSVLAFCGIGRPWSFVTMLESLRATVCRSVVFQDHHQFADKDLALIESERASCGAEAVITTEKDIARLGTGVAISDLYVLSIELEIEGSSHFAEYITDRVNAQDQPAPA